MAEQDSNPHTLDPDQAPKKASALYRHCARVYELMHVISDQDEVNGKFFTVWKGQTTELIKSLKISQAYYGAIYEKLEEIGCVTRLRKGSRQWDSVYALHYHPSRVTWPEVGTSRKDASERSLTRANKLGTLEQAVDNLVRSLGGLNIVEAFSNFEERLLRLEKAAGLTDDGKDATLA